MIGWWSVIHALQGRAEIFFKVRCMVVLPVSAAVTAHERQFGQFSQAIEI